MNKCVFEQYKQANCLEKELGSVENQENLFSFEEILSLDEKSEFPEKQANLLTSLGVNKYYVPQELGGNLNSFEEFVSIFRSIYRRDPSLALGYGATTFMAAIHSFIAGNEGIKRKVADIILQGHTLSVAYHESNHGNDLLGNEVHATLQENSSYLINGKKWVINNAAVSKGLTVFTKTSDNAGARGFSLFFVDKSSIDESTIAYIPKVKTLGVKGCRIAGAEFKNTKVSQDNIIGKIGDGFELTYKAFQITRATLPGMSIGAADTALRCVLDFANKRTLYGKSILKIPHVYETLTDSFIRILICDIFSITASRSLHCIPEQMSVIASLTKFYIPRTIQTLLKDLSVILGARYYIRDGKYSIFQKILRDYPVVSLGHSSDVICMGTILPQMKSLLTKETRSKNIEHIFSLSHPLQDFNPQNLKMSNNGYNDIFNSIDLIEKDIETLKLYYDTKKIVEKYIVLIKKIISDLKKNVKTIQVNINSFSKKTYQFIESYCNCFIGISCIWIWLYNQSKISDYFDKGAWLVLALKNIFPENIMFENRKYIDETLEHLKYLFTNKKSFSLVPIQYH